MQVSFFLYARKCISKQVFSPNSSTSSSKISIFNNKVRVRVNQPHTYILEISRKKQAKNKKADIISLFRSC